MVKEGFREVYDKICMLTTIYISLGAPRLIINIATHSVVHDGITQPLKEWYVMEYGITRRKGHLSVILMDHPGFGNFPWVYFWENLIIFYVNFLAYCLMWVRDVPSLTKLQNSLVVLLLFSDTGTDLGFNLPVAS